MKDIIEAILEIKSRCRIAEEIGIAHGLTEREIICLLALDKNGAETSNDLSARMNLSASRGSRVLNRLVDRGFLEAKSDPADRRRTNLALTSSGERCVADIRRRKTACEKRLVSGLSESERATIEEGVGLLLKVM